MVVVDASVLVDALLIDGPVPGVNYVGGSRQLRRRVGAPTPCHGRGLGRAAVGGWLAVN